MLIFAIRAPIDEQEAWTGFIILAEGIAEDNENIVITDI